MKTLCDLLIDAAETQTKIYGVDVETLNAKGITWMLHRLHIQLYKVPYKGEEVDIATWPSGVDRLFALRDYQMLRKNGELLVGATTEWMMIDLNKRRPIRQPADVVEISMTHDIENLHIASILDEKDFELGEPGGSRNFTATFDNIDFNGHVTQSSYMGWIINSLPFEFLKGHILHEIEVVYAHEIMPDSSIHSAYRIEEKENNIVVYHQITSEDGARTHCVAKSIWQK